MSSVQDKLNLESVDTTPPADNLTETEALKVYPRLKKVAEMHALWLSYEMLLERENAKYVRLQRLYRKHPAMGADYKIQDPPKGLMEEERVKWIKDEKDHFTGQRDLRDNLQSGTIKHFKVSEEARSTAKTTYDFAMKFFKDHWKPLIREKMSKPREASIKLVEEKMSGKDLEEIVLTFRNQWKEFEKNLSRTESYSSSDDEEEETDKPLSASSSTITKN